MRHARVNFSTHPCLQLGKLALVYLLSLILAMASLPLQALSVSPPSPQDRKLATADPAASQTHQQLLYALLLGEIAGNRGQAQVALAQYLEVARRSEDPAIAQQATQWAVQFQNAEAALDASVMWAQFAPKDLQAQMVASTLLVGQSIEQTIPYLTRAIEINPVEVNQHIVAIQTQLSEKSAQHLKMAFQLIAKNRPQDAWAQITAAQTSASLGEITSANRFVDSALELNPELTPAIQLKARLIRHEDDSDSRALSFLKDNVNKFSENAELRLFYANALLDANRLSEAKDNLKHLTQNKEYGGQAFIFLAEIYMNQENFSASQDMLQQALHFPRNRDNAQYLLGELAEHNGKIEEAIGWYTRVNPGPYQVTATLRAAYLLRDQQDYSKAIYLLHDASPNSLEEQKQLVLAEVDILTAGRQVEDAYVLINSVLEKIPTDTDILLAHSMVAIKLKKWTTAENDLKTLLEINPHNAEALNTLGYALSLQKDKRASAKPYILQALQIAPNNPIYLDTLGWLHFQLGEYEEALSHLQKAMELSKGNPEIAAHLVEVLWVMGKKEEARSILAQTQAKTPENEHLKEVMARLNIKPN